MKKVLLSMVFALFGYFAMSAQTTKVTVEVEGLACPFCAVRLEDDFIKIKGAKNVEIDLKKSLLTFEIAKEQKPSEADIKKKVEKAGFTAGKVTFAAIENNKGDLD